MLTWWLHRVQAFDSLREHSLSSDHGPSAAEEVRPKFDLGRNYHSWGERRRGKTDNQKSNHKQEVPIRQHSELRAFRIFSLFFPLYIFSYNPQNEPREQGFLHLFISDSSSSLRPTHAETSLGNLGVKADLIAASPCLTTSLHFKCADG